MENHLLRRKRCLSNWLRPAMQRLNVTRTNQNQHLCHVCGRRQAVGKEHIPPQHAENRDEVDINYVDGNTPSGDMKFHVIRSPDGFWVSVLCDECNHKIGWRYGDAYKEFLSQITSAAGLEDTSGGVFIHLKGIYPLRILKQMFAMFLGAVPYEPAPVWKGIQEFVRKRDSPLPDNTPSVYLYKNVSKMGRIVPCCGILELSTHKTLVMSEVSWPPLGIVFAFQSDNRLNMMENVTRWGEHRFKDRADLLVKLPKLRVTSHYPLGFGTAREVEREQARRGLIYLFHVPENSASRSDIGVLWKSKKS